jgi:hypothetical protein
MWQCAQVVSPQGGAVDEAPPELLSSEPANYSTHFNSKKIVLTFDEYIRLKNVRDNLLFSPVLKHDPDFLIKKKSIVITLFDTLQDNTTYTINFNDAIVDITEENPLSGFQYIFSTGSYVDSLKLKGNLLDAYSLAPEKSALVMLYNTLEDSVPYLQKPNYLSKTNERGEYQITNMKQGVYKAFALADQNKNYVYDPTSEKIGFLDSVITIKNDTVIAVMNLLMFQERPQKQYLKSYDTKEQGKFTLSFNRRALPIKLLPLSENGVDRLFLIEQNEKEDSLVFWISPPHDLDSLVLSYSLPDGFSDTVSLSFTAHKKAPKLSMVMNTTGSGKFDLGAVANLTFNNPIDTVDYSLFEMKEDSTVVPHGFFFSDSVGRVLSTRYPWKENTNYTIAVKGMAVRDLFGAHNDSATFSFVTQELKYYGTLKINISNCPKSAVLLLLKDGKVAEKRVVKKTTKDLLFSYLPPGKYGLKLIHDDNDNNLWDPGHYLQKQQAEVVSIYTGTITIRSNWDQEVEWILDNLP